MKVSKKIHILENKNLFFCKIKKTHSNYFLKVLITSPCSASTIIQYGVKGWPIWECETSKFKWYYNNK